MSEVVIHTAELAPSQESTERMVKIIIIDYAKSYFKKVTDNVIDLNAEERTQLLSLLEDFKDLFDGTL